MDSIKNLLQKETFEEKLQRIRKGQGINKVDRDSVHIPNTTQVPNIVFDKYMSALTGNELKVLLYLIRKTFGYRKIEGDYIPLSQFVSGTKKQNGDELDKGTGMTTKSVIRALQVLEELGLVQVTRRKVDGKHNAINFYSLSLKG